MNRNSKELASRIDVMVAYQNGEKMQYRTHVGTGRWIDLTDHGCLSFNWEKRDFRVKPKLKEGWVRPGHVHQHMTGCETEEYIYVREIEDNT